MSSGAETVDALNLTGRWHGQFSYPRVIEPTLFTAKLHEDSGWLTGVTEEIASVGPSRGQPITATVQGRREIDGRWTIPGVWPGKFLMIRAGAMPAALTLEVAEKV